MQMSELVTRAVRKAARNIRVAMPCRVVSYDPGRSMVAVEIVMPEREDDGRETAQPVIPEVPVSFPRGGGFFMTHPISAGDTGLVVFGDRDVGGWVADGDTAMPESERMHSITDGFFIPGVQGGGVSSNGEDVVISYAGSVFRLTGGGNVNIETGGSVSINASGSVSINSSGLTHNGTNVGNDHVHGGVSSGGSTTQGPQ